MQSVLFLVAALHTSTHAAVTTARPIPPAARLPLAPSWGRATTYNPLQRARLFDGLFTVKTVVADASGLYYCCRLSLLAAHPQHARSNHRPTFGSSTRPYGRRVHGSAPRSATRTPLGANFASLPMFDAGVSRSNTSTLELDLAASR